MWNRGSDYPSPGINGIKRSFDMVPNPSDLMTNEKYNSNKNVKSVINIHLIDNFDILVL